MNISQDTEEVLKFLDYISDNSLRKRIDIAEILEIGASAGDYDNVNRVVLFGTSLWTLHLTVNKHKDNSSASSILIGEMNKSADILLEGLKKIVVNRADSSIYRFEEIYFAKTEGCFKNLIDLAHDLHILKKLQTDLQNKSKQ
jgi:hypothetical protein